MKIIGFIGCLLAIGGYIYAASLAWGSGNRASALLFLVSAFWIAAFVVNRI